MAKPTVNDNEKQKLFEIVSRCGDSGAIISTVINDLSVALQIPKERARHIIRYLLDKGAVKTDADFRLLVNE